MTSTLNGARTHRLSNGLTLVGEPLPQRRVAAWSLLLPCGSATEPQGRDGLTKVLEGVSYRGAGSRNARELSDALDDLGVDRGGGAETESVSYGGATLADYLPDALKLYADIVLRPQLPEGEWEAQRDLALQSLKTLEDNPSRKMFVTLRRTYFPNALGRVPSGTRAGLEALTLDDLRADHARRFLPQGGVLGVAGRFDWDELVAQIEALLGAWEGEALPIGEAQPLPGAHYQHIAQETAQVHIGIAYQGVPITDPRHYAFRLANAVLSGGMGARLFTEVREKRGLVYSVSAQAQSTRQCGFTLSYAGTTPQRAQETLDVLLGELARMSEGVSEAELERARTGMVSSLEMQEDSSRARAASIARDQFVLGRVRPVEEIAAGIEAVTPSDIRAYYEAHPAREFTITTLGPEPLTVPTF